MTDPFFHYLQFEKRYSPLTIVAYQSDFDQFLNFCNTEYGLASAAEADYNIIRAWMVTLIGENLEPRSVNRKIACLKSYFKFLLKQGLIESNPAQRVKTPKVKKRLPVFVEEAHLNILLDEGVFADNFQGIRDRLVIELLYGTGMRLAELLALKPADINYYDRLIKVTGKGNKERIIPINKNLEEVLINYNKVKNITFLNAQGNLPLILTDKGDKAYPVLIQRIVKGYLSHVSNVEKKSPHVLRHSFATHMLNNGADLNSIKELLGHSSLAATQVYTHNSMEKLKSIFKQAHPKA